MISFVKPTGTKPLQTLPLDFNWKRYVELNDDVKEIYNTEEAATQHYMYEGHAQNRRYVLKNLPSDFNWNEYLGLNADVYIACNTHGSAIMHYEFHGFKESRLYSIKQAGFPDDFQWELYRTMNPEFHEQIQCEITAINHYYTYGMKHNLPHNYVFKNVPSDFNWELYRELNDDVKEHFQTELQCKLHYETDGYIQDRRYNIPEKDIPEDFDWRVYVELNTDVKKTHNSEIRAKIHYYITGKNEGRIYKLCHTPVDFDPNIYLELNDSIPKFYQVSELMVKLHYDLFGRHDKLPYLAIFKCVPLDFNWKDYVHLNPDISDICTTELRAKSHYERLGFHQTRKYFISPEEKAQISEYAEKQILTYEKHPFLFHKFILGLSKPDNEIKYNIISNISTDYVKEHQMVAHLHCYNIDKFEHFYAKYMNVIQLHCSLSIVTFSIGNELNIPKYDNMVVLHVPNIGMDIGAKYACIDFMKKKGVDYNHILFLHSKQDDLMRKAYWEPLLLNMAHIVRIMKTDTKIGIFVPPLIFMGDYANIIYKDHFIDPKNVTCRWNFGNSLYMNDWDRYYQYQEKNCLFPEGNCFVSNKAVAEMLYGDTMMYNLLNAPTSFDAVWVKAYYGGRMLKDVGQNIREIYRFFRSSHSSHSRTRVYGNNIAWGAGHKGHADNMIEHSYERMVFKAVQKLGLQVKIMPWINRSEYLATLDKYNYEVNVMLRNHEIETNELKDDTY
jgi:hypothetical protein